MSHPHRHRGDTATQLERCLGAPATFWTAREENYRRHFARLLETESPDRHKAWVESIAASELAKLGWVEQGSSLGERTAACLRFFGVASVHE